ncbi:hypothetical protein ACFO4P_17085 [Epilithonimonas pallida]|uniref:XRE family transcriptional regulator n=1 Tax=Epilithonimonas pallida TaxID=373671 RepID=A0ABY1R4S4_9FLAO|nr:hypothetical protein [Epilithonimonas pallida]SMP94703.1 hypothetical protein SAMN05421679_106102 [Epilithonimonas pallida]
MDYKKELQELFAKLPAAISRTELAKLAGIDRSNFKNYIENPDKVVTEKTYNKIMGAVGKAYEQFTLALKK